MIKNLHLLDGIEVATVTANVGDLHKLSYSWGYGPQGLAGPSGIEGQDVGLPQVDPVGWGFDDNPCYLKKIWNKLFWR